MKGGILSPILVNVFILDDLSNGLNELKIGCNFKVVFVNYLVYTDDISLLAPSLSEQHILIDHCVTNAEGNNVFYILKKSKCMCVRPNCMKNLYFPKIVLNYLEILIVSKEKYLDAFIADDCSDDEVVTHEKYKC